MEIQVVADEFPVPAEGDDRPYALLVTLHAKPDQVDKVEEMLLANVEPTLAEPGCVTYYLSRDRADPTTFIFFEAYQGLEGFRTHLATPYITALLDQLPAYLISDVEMRFLAIESATY
jgi:quinol monooxygenase YgiN